ncbi:hypothetical protein KO529_03835 [Arenibacter algicola]|uniref:hypothetical protein n=1 Tax=Arenibacter algicola TaxID=616991 RepID=UPI001C07CAC9|nr:hypothetical protein [Arenibacter algicola]MBU2903904.1 hypothetical protein [Arenibacter algicola]
MKAVRIKYLSFICVVLMYTFHACKTENRKENIVYENLAPIDDLNDIWEITDAGEITWNVTPKKHTDHIEMSGLGVSGIISYGVDENRQIVLSRKVVWPMLRTIPNDTHASLIHDFPKDITPEILLNGVTSQNERPVKFRYNGLLSVLSNSSDGLEIKREIFPSTSEAVFVELITVINKSKLPVKTEIKPLHYSFITPEDKGVYGSYNIEAKCTGIEKTINSGETISVPVFYSARKQGQHFMVDGYVEREKREAFVTSLSNSLILETPDKVINEMFRFAKIRATESIYNTKGGLMHGPGGGRYYAAIWANDQPEYVNPFFPFVGNENGNESAINSFRHFARFINDEYKPIPSSIIAEGNDIWDGAGDRGDAAMIAYGASRFALAYGDTETAKELLPLIKWCLEYCKRKMMSNGIIASDSDELEGRFPSGKANLSTNMLAYGGFKSASKLLKALGMETELSQDYEKTAKILQENCDQYFGGNVMGYYTYKYFELNEKLRSWICLPLTMGIFDRKEETLKALFSPELWNKNGIYTEAGNKTFWDRSTLYAFKGILYAGETDLAMKYFKYYSQKRLLGEHVPFAVEAFPEGDQRHLSAESGLYCRVITEGLFGIEPTGLKSFTCKPVLPEEWNYMTLSNIKAFQTSFDLMVRRKANKLEVTLISNDKVIDKKMWDGNNKIAFTLN